MKNNEFQMYKITDYLELGYTQDAAQWALNNNVQPDSFLPLPVKLSKTTLNAIGSARGTNGKLYVNNAKANQELSKKFGLHAAYNNHWIDAVKSRIIYDWKAEKWRVLTA